jgi:hypothetical protein
MWFQRRHPRAQRLTIGGGETGAGGNEPMQLPKLKR